MYFYNLSTLTHEQVYLSYLKLLDYLTLDTNKQNKCVYYKI